jgi:tRNA A-37 threonylcarbamoyl transferase component Bud32
VTRDANRPTLHATLTPAPLTHPSRNELWLLGSATEPPRLVKVYTGAGARLRRRTEMETLEHWRRAGYAVPRVYPAAAPASPRPHLVLDYIPGQTLRDCLRDDRRDIEQRLSLAGEVLAGLSARQARALKLGDWRLLRDDANTGNFVVDGDGRIFQVDFERVPAAENLHEAAAMELAKLMRWMARDLGRPNLDRLAALAVKAYGGQSQVIGRVIDRTLARLGQWFHRFRDARKRAQEGEITKYDIAEGLARRRLGAPN